MSRVRATVLVAFVVCGCRIDHSKFLGSTSAADATDAPDETADALVLDGGFEGGPSGDAPGGGQEDVTVDVAADTSPPEGGDAPADAANDVEHVDAFADVGGVDTSPVFGTITCTTEDRWRVAVSAGQDIRVTVDTVDAESAFDIYSEIYSSGDEALADGDDEIECTFPPPAFQCPDYTYAAVVDDELEVSVRIVGGSVCPADTLGYELGATLNGVAAVLELVVNDG